MSGVVVITGGGRGIGAATALACARAGFDVCVGYRADHAAAADVVAACERTGVRTSATAADVGGEADVIRLFAGPIDSTGDRAGPTRASWHRGPGWMT
jgi:NAD(P)-dependent dehydrogenase (short-subunit alcohol dehydrogenase family)